MMQIMNVGKPQCWPEQRDYMSLLLGLDTWIWFHNLLLIGCQEFRFFGPEKLHAFVNF